MVTHLLRDVPLISIIDDDESMRTSIMRLIRSLGFTACAFPTAREFLQSEQFAKTSCLISDVQMPEMSGLQLQDVLRDRGHDIPIIFITAFPNERVRAEALSRGAVCFLNKPFDGEVLVRCLKTALDIDNNG